MTITEVRKAMLEVYDVQVKLHGGHQGRFAGKGKVAEWLGITEREVDMVLRDVTRYGYHTYKHKVLARYRRHLVQ